MNALGLDANWHVADVGVGKRAIMVEDQASLLSAFLYYYWHVACTPSVPNYPPAVTSSQTGQLRP